MPVTKIIMETQLRSIIGVPDGENRKKRNKIFKNVIEQKFCEIKKAWIDLLAKPNQETAYQVQILSYSGFHYFGRNEMAKI